MDSVPSAGLARSALLVLDEFIEDVEQVVEQFVAQAALATVCGAEGPEFGAQFGSVRGLAGPGISQARYRCWQTASAARLHNGCCDIVRERNDVAQRSQIVAGDGLSHGAPPLPLRMPSSWWRSL